MHNYDARSSKIPPALELFRDIKIAKGDFDAGIREVGITLISNNDNE